LRGNRQATLALGLSSALTLLGWGLIHLLWEVPYRSFLWNETLLRAPVEAWLGIPWESWVTDSGIEAWVQGAIRALGLGLLGASLAAVLAFRNGVRPWAILAAGTPSLCAVALAYTLDKGMRAGELIEYSAQVLSPLCLFLYCRGSLKEHGLLRALKAMVALTFLGHGLYAFGYYPVPGHFVDMVISILGVTDTQALALLKLAGILDFVVCLAIFLPRAAIPALAYAAFWGLATALARPLSAFSDGSEAEGLIYGLAEALCRLPHALVPIAALLLVARKMRSEPYSAPEQASFPVATLPPVL
jgi:hypothetical protein